MIRRFTAADVQRGIPPIGVRGTALTMEAPFELDGQTFTHRECIVDFDGTDIAPAIAVDIFDGTGGALLRMSGNWAHYGSSPPAIIHEHDERYEGFIDACMAGDESSYARRTWPAR